MKIVTVIGARPQFVKAAVVSRAIARSNRDGDKTIEEVIVHTGQHYDANMSSIFFEELQMTEPDYNLGISNASHGAMTGRMLEAIETVIVSEKPDAILVYGDTNSTLAGALAAGKLHVPVAHVEAGLRSFNMMMPEEINRILTDRISAFLFCPTKTAVMNLLHEGIGDGRNVRPRSPVIWCVGDVMLDAALFYNRIKQASPGIRTLLEQLEGNYCLATVHRAENTDDCGRLSNIMTAFESIAETTEVVLLLHPRTRKYMVKSGINVRRVRLMDPVGYFDMLSLLENCRAVMTDSGGLQKEAAFFQKRCLVLRDETEWTELVDVGSNILVGACTERILAAESSLHENCVSVPANLYGEGDAGEKIVRILLDAVLQIGAENAENKQGAICG